MKVCPTCKSEYAGGEVFCPVDAARLVSRSQVGEPIDPDDPLVGATLGDRYRIVRRIGEGGMGIVYEALHVVIEKRVALKVLRDDFSSRPEVVERFRQEAKSASRIGHEHIVDISDFGETPSGQSYFVMEFLQGEDLANVLARERALPVKRAVHIALQCCRALGAAHAKGIVHRDMKPENIFLTRRDVATDFVKIVDFGIAKMSDIETAGAPGRKLTKTGMIFGTPEYMSPEQAAGKALDHRVDVYAVGVILYEMLVGRVPFVGDSFMGILTQHMFEQPPPLRTLNPDLVCPTELEALIFRALAKDPNQRFQSMQDLGRALVGAVDLSGAFQDEDTLTGFGEAVRPIAPAVRRVEAAATVADLGASMPDVPGVRAPRRIGFAAAVLLVGVAVASAGAYALLSRGSGAPPVGTPEASTAAPPAATVQPVGSAAVPTAPVSAPVPTLAPDAATAVGNGGGALGPTLVPVTVHTRPSGARVEVADTTLACEPTPCELSVPAGLSILLRAAKGAATGERELSPSQAMSVELVLVPPRRGRADAGGEDALLKRIKRQTEDLHIPEVFLAPERPSSEPR